MSSTVWWFWMHHWLCGWNVKWVHLHWFVCWFWRYSGGNSGQGLQGRWLLMACSHEWWDQTTVWVWGGVVTIVAIIAVNLSLHTCPTLSSKISSSVLKQSNNQMVTLIAGHVWCSCAMIISTVYFCCYYFSQSSYDFKPRVKQRKAKHLPGIAKITNVVEILSKVYFLCEIQYTACYETGWWLEKRLHNGWHLSNHWGGKTKCMRTFHTKM